MRVLFSSTFGHGHVFPMVPLAQAFQSAGHDVLWAGPGDVADLAGGAGIATVRAGLRDPSELGRLAAEVATIDPPDRAAFMFPRMFGELFTPPMVSDLLPIARDWAPDLMIHEASELGSALVGAVIGRPSVTHSFGGAVPPGFLAAAGQRLEPLWLSHGVAPRRFAGTFATAHLDICPPSIQPIDKAGSRVGERCSRWATPAPRRPSSRRRRRSST
jgi:hypothetical protein